MSGPAHAKPNILSQQAVPDVEKQEEQELVTPTTHSFGTAGGEDLSSDVAGGGDVQTQLNQAVVFGHSFGQLGGPYNSGSTMQLKRSEGGLVTQLKSNHSAPIQKQGYGYEDEEQMMSVWHDDSTGITSPEVPMSIVAPLSLNRESRKTSNTHSSSEKVGPDVVTDSSNTLNNNYSLESFSDADKDLFSEYVNFAGQGHSVTSNISRVLLEGAQHPRRTRFDSHITNLASLIENTDAFNASDASYSRANNRYDALKRVVGPRSLVGRRLNAGNYGLELLSGIDQGQDFGEALLGSAGGGYVGNRMGDYLFSHKTKGGIPSTSYGWTDIAINVANSGLQIAGAPEEITDATSVAAALTPSSFATSLANNTGRGIWNLGEGLITGDYEDLEQQGQDIVHGSGGAYALQGLGMMTHSIHAAFQDEDIDVTLSDYASEEAISGKYGPLAKLGNHLGSWLHDAFNTSEDELPRTKKRGL